MSEDNPQFDLDELASRQLLAPRAPRGRPAPAAWRRLLGPAAARARGAVPASLLSQLAGEVTFGSNASDPVPKKALAATSSRRSRRRRGTEVKVNTVDHNTFQEQINTYLQGQPHDVFTWFAGYRMQFFAEKELLAPIDDVWATLKPQFSPAMQDGVEGPRRPLLLRADLQLPVGGLLPARASSSRRATRSRTPGTSSSRSPRR